MTKGKKKQDVLVADGTGAMRFSVWETEVGELAADECYQWNGVTVRDYLGEKFISKENCSVESIKDIGDVDERKFLSVTKEAKTAKGCTE